MVSATLVHFCKTEPLCKYMFIGWTWLKKIKSLAWNFEPKGCKGKKSKKNNFSTMWLVVYIH